LEAAIEATLAVLRSGDLLLTLGAGSVTHAADRLLAILQGTSERASDAVCQGG
jgi:UDP-N-acetylmuramate-alanine ligase